MSKTTFTAFLILLLLLTLFVFKADAEAPEPIIIIPESIIDNDVKTYAYRKVFTTFGDNQWDSFDSLIKKESKWNCKAQNPNSTAYGLGQFLNSTWRMTSYTKSSDCYFQVEATVEYIQKVYKTPANAWAHSQKYNWY